MVTIHDGCHEEAEAVVRGFEESAGVDLWVRRAKGESAPVDAVTGAQGLWSAALRRRTAGIWVVWLGVERDTCASPLTHPSNPGGRRT